MYKILLMISILSHSMLNYGHSSGITKNPILTEFVGQHEFFKKDPKATYEQKSLFTAIATTTDPTTKNISNDTTLILSRDSSAVYMIQNKKPMIFLKNPLGSWIAQENSPVPMKISGGYTMFGIMNVDDVLGIDYYTLYNIIETNAKSVSLQTKENNVTYPYVTITKEGQNKFFGIFMDRNKVPIKSGFFELGTINNIHTLKKAIFKDLIMDTNRQSSFEVFSIKKSKIPAQTLFPERVKLIFNVIK